MLDEFSKRRFEREADAILAELERGFKNPSHLVMWEVMEIFLAAGADKVRMNKRDNICSYLHEAKYKGKIIFSTTFHEVAA